jgi:N-acetylglutamate synthase-like GNAT family acetyltransferase
LGRKLFEIAAEKASSLGARKMNISATPSENTIHFYSYLGFTLAKEVDAELFTKEPEDIHLEYALR